MGNRFLDENCERIVNGQKRRYRRHSAKLCSTRGRCPERPPKNRNPDWYTGKRATTGRERGAPVRKARVLGEGGWVYYRPRYATGNLRSCASRVHREACDDRARAGRTGPRGEDFGEHGGGGWWIFAGAERCGARGLAHGEAGGGAAATGFWIDFGIVLNVYFIAIRTWVIDFSTKIVNEF